MANMSPPWPPEMDDEVVSFAGPNLVAKYNGAVDDLGWTRWSSDYRQHRGNGVNPDVAWNRVNANIDEIRAGQSVTVWPAPLYSVPWPPSLDTDAPRFADQLRALYQEHQQRDVDTLGWFRWSSDYRVARANGLSHDSAWNKIEREILKIWGVTPPAPPAGECSSPVIGLERRGNTFILNGSPCTPEFSSEFNLLRIRKENREMYEQLLDDMVRYRKQGSRIFTNVGGWAALPGDFWYGHGVYPVTFTPWQFDRKDGHLRPKTDANGNPMYGPIIPAWQDYDENFVGMVEDFVRRRLALHLTTGDCQIIYCDIINGQPRYNFDKELNFHRHICDLLHRVDPTYAVFYDLRNEYPLNSPQGGSPHDVEEMRRIARDVKQRLPRTLVGLGACVSEEPAKLLESVEGFDVCFVHVGRDWPQCLKRTLGLKHWEGNWGAFPWPYCHGEPKPGNIPPYNDGVGDDGYMATDRIDQLIALHTMICATQQGDNLFTGASVLLETYPSLMPGYKEIPEIIATHIPEDMTGWSREFAPGGAILYFTNGKKFLTSTDETWNSTPPHSVAHWKMYTGRGIELEILEGVGNPPQGRTGFIVGEFA